MKKTLKMIMLLFITKTGISQSVVNSSGGQATISGQTHEYSIGEVVVHSGTTLIVTQGLLQPKKSTPATGSTSTLISDDQLQVFPIPTQDILNLKANFASHGTLLIHVTDIFGKLVSSKEFVLHSGTELNQLNMSGFVEGNYIIQAEFITASNTKLINVFNLTKIK